MISRLLENGLNSAISNKNPEIAEEIVKKGKIKLNPQIILNILHEADRECEFKPKHVGFFNTCNDWTHPRSQNPNKCEKNAEKWIRTLIESKMDIDTQHKLTGRTALMWACYQGFDGCVKLLLEAKADPLKVNGYETPFQIATNRQKAGCVKLLLDAMPDAEEVVKPQKI